MLDISSHFTINMSGISYNSILAHEAVFNRIIEGDAEGARRSMDEHLADVRVKLSATLAEEEAAELLRAQPVS